MARVRIRSCSPGFQWRVFLDEVIRGGWAATRLEAEEAADRVLIEEVT